MTLRQSAAGSGSGVGRPLKSKTRRAYPPLSCDAARWSSRTVLTPRNEGLASGEARNPCFWLAKARNKTLRRPNNTCLLLLQPRPLRSGVLPALRRDAGQTAFASALSFSSWMVLGFRSGIHRLGFSPFTALVLPGSSAGTTVWTGRDRLLHKPQAHTTCAGPMKRNPSQGLAECDRSRCRM